MNELRLIFDRLRALVQGKARKILIFGLVAIGLAVFAINSVDASGISSPNPSPHRVSKSDQAPVLPEIYVHVVGRVKSPGIYRLRSSSRVFDAIFAAGGLLKNADQTSANFARVLSDGEQILILSNSGSIESGSASASGIGARAQGPSAVAKINLNRADQTLLETLPGVGPTIAGRILDYRQASGSFRSVKDLMKVTGIGAKMFAKIADLVTV